MSVESAAAYAPTHSAIEDYIQDYHRRNPGATSAAFAHLPARIGGRCFPSSYHALADLIPNDGAPAHVVDLCCGDGYLLGVLNDRHAPHLQLTGIDLSEAELAAARRRLPPSVALRRESAQALTLPDRCADFAVSHLALALVQDIGAALGEARRILKPGGTLGLIESRQFLVGEVYDIYLDVATPIFREEGLPPMGDPRARNEAGWRELLASAFRDVTFDDIDIEWYATPEQIWNRLALTYVVDWLPADAQSQLRTRLINALSDHVDADGKIASGMGLRRISAMAD